MIAIPLIGLVSAPEAVVVAALLLALGGITLRPRGPLVLSALALVLVALPFADHLGPAPSPGKTLGHLIADTDARVVFSRWNPIARIDVVGWEDAESSRTRGLWSIWGRGADNHEPSPPQYTIAQDGDALTLMYRYGSDPNTLRFLDDHVLRLPYLAVDAPDVLVIGAGGGTDVLAALRFGARHVTAVDINPVTASLLRTHFAAWLGDVFRTSPAVDLQVSEGRHFARRSGRKFGLIQVNGVDTLAAMSSGSYVLAESYLYTVEAIRDLWARLDARGALSIVIMDGVAADSPPRHMLRLVGVIMEALRTLGVVDPAAHLGVLGAPEPANVTRLVTTYNAGHRPIMVMQLLLSRRPLEPAVVARLGDFAARAGFRTWHLPGRETAPEVRPLLADETTREEFIRRFPLAIDTTTDDRPFFFTFYRWLDLPRHLRLDANRASATEQLMLLVMLAQSLVLAIVLILAPLIVFRRRGLAVPGRAGFVAYFAALGLGFICIEIALIQKLVLFLGYPTRSLSVTLAAMLIASGLGSLMSERVQRVEPRTFTRLGAMLAVLVTLALLTLPHVVGALLGASAAVRILATVALLTPLGLVLGMFFPLGLRALPDRRLVPWAWGANGLATVVGTVLAIIVAMSYGFTTVILGGLLIYAVGVFAIRRALEPL